MTSSHQRKPDPSVVWFAPGPGSMTERAKLRPTITPMALCLAVALILALGFAPSPASAAQPWWRLTTNVKPTHLPPGGEGTIVVRAINQGDASVNSSVVPVTITDQLPPGLTATSITGKLGALNLFGTRLGELTCSLPSLSCQWESTEPLEPYEEIEVEIGVKVEGAASGAANVAEIEGGQPQACDHVRKGEGHFTDLLCEQTGAVEHGSYEATVGSSPVPSHAQSWPLTISNEPTPFGVENTGLAVEDALGATETQAGAHPFQVADTLATNQNARPYFPPALIRNVSVKLPPGLVGNATVMPRCGETDFSTVISETNLCSPATQVGVATVTAAVSLQRELPPDTFPVPIFNLVPGVGEPARFGFEINKVPVIIDTSVRTGQDYGVTATVKNLSQSAGIISSVITFWGVPGDPRHDNSRGWNCVAGGVFGEGMPPCVSGEQQNFTQPFLTLPTSCTGPLKTSVAVEPWNEALGNPREPDASDVQPTPGLTGCERVPFDASFSAEPDTHAADSPAGVIVRVHVPQEVSNAASGIAESAIRNTTVTFPEGMTLNSASAGGLMACSIPEIGYEPAASSSEDLRFTPDIGSPFCPDASKVGTVTLKTPILKQPLKGGVYVAAQDENPFRSLVAAYIVAQDPESGVIVKLAGDVTLDETSGRITASFENTPQAPVEDLEMHIFGGSRPTFVTPAHCGTFTTSATFTPWSGGQDVHSTSDFAITSGPHGSPCPGTLPFAPGLLAGTTVNQAGAFSPLSSTISREDGEQDIQVVQITTPPGLSGVLSGVPLCAEPAADTGTCGAGSLIGETTATVGVGNAPFAITGGRVYITGPYRGAPFGLSIVTPAKAGPYDLGKGVCDCVVIRAALQVDPHTAQITVATDASGAFKIPTILDGVPLHLRAVNVTINRPSFVINPTNCNSQSVTARLSGAEGTLDNASEPFTAANCAKLGFAPKLYAATAGHASKALGASLTTKVSYPSAPLGSQANIARVKVELPLQLPSELRTLQRACRAAVFAANPASCPAESVVGHATVHTPLLPVPLVGPAYFVSQGSEAFPALTVVLQGYGLTFDLVGSTLIRKGITSTTFKTTPDVPFTTFELVLPRGKFSALASNLPATAPYDFCGQHLSLRNEFVAQNGAVIRRSTPIAVTGCATKHKAKHRRAKHARAHLRH